MQISPRDKKVITVGGIFLVLVLIWNVMTPSGGGKSTAGMESIPAAKHDTEINKRTQARLQREMTDMSPKIDALAYNVPPDELVPQTVKELQQIAAKSGVHIREVKPVRPKTLSSGLGTSVPMEVHFLAPFQPNAMKFLYYVEDPAGRMVVDKLDISSADPRRKTVEVSAQVTVYTKVVAGAATADTGDKSNAASSN